jgi:hypothetical protein
VGDPSHHVESEMMIKLLDDTGHLYIRAERILIVFGCSDKDKMDRHWANAVIVMDDVQQTFVFVAEKPSEVIEVLEAARVVG